MKILVTGGAGFIGSNLALGLESKGHEVTVLDNFSSGKEENLKDFKGKLIKAAVLDETEFEDEFDAIIHEASITDTTFPDDDEMMRQNVDSFKKMLELAKENDAKFVYISSAAVYGNGPAPMKEDQVLTPLNAYGESKKEMDKIASENFDDMHIVGLRYFNVFGPREEYKGKSSSMILQLGKKMMDGIKPRLFHDGEQKRDHIYVKDVVRATILALDAKKSGIYNVGTGKATTFNELIELLNEVLGTEFEIEYFDSPIEAVYQNFTQADTTDAEEFLGFKAEYDLKEAMKDYFEYVRKEK